LVISFTQKGIGTLGQFSAAQQRALFLRTFEGEIEASEAITGQGVSTALHYHGIWTIYFHDLSDDLEQ
jgi:hypothetical protein